MPHIDVLVDGRGRVQWTTQHTSLERIANLHLLVSLLQSLQEHIVNALVQQLRIGQMHDKHLKICDVWIKANHHD